MLTANILFEIFVSSIVIIPFFFILFKNLDHLNVIERWAAYVFIAVFEIAAVIYLMNFK
ncbi:hypothetical protein NST12_16635 [Bacillus sp. FSL W8-1127]|uniref:hypothetical protein n=1 Tax=Bacillus sp. FSL W8-1127 TaxID=2954710 RepID=UPI000AFC8138